jgi:hypothetical protein
MTRRMPAAAVIAAGVALLMAAAGSPRGAKEGGTFRIGMASGFFDSIDPVAAQGVGNFIVGRVACESRSRRSRSTPSTRRLPASPARRRSSERRAPGS